MNHFQRYLAEEFVEEYSEGRLSRRQALKLIASVTGSLVVASSFLAGCAPPAEETATAAPNTPQPAISARSTWSVPRRLSRPTRAANPAIAAIDPHPNAPR